MDEVSAFLSHYPELKRGSLKGSTVKCSLSGHEMPLRLEVLRSYVAGKKFTRLRAEAGFDYKSLEPLIISSVKRRNQLFCTLTNCYLNRKPVEVEGHLAGKRYKTALEKYNAGEVKLFQEKVKTQKPDTQLTQEHSVESQARDSDSNGKVCAPSDSSDFITQCNDSNPSGEEPEAVKSLKRKRVGAPPVTKRLKLATMARKGKAKTEYIVELK